MKSSRFAGLSAQSSLLFLVSCGGSTLLPDVTDAGEDVVIPDTPCGHYAGAYCAKEAACSSGTLITRNYGDLATCVTRQTLACTDALAAPNTGWTTALYQQCTDDLPSISCTNLLDNTLPAECSPNGPGATGSPCTFNAQCASGFCSSDRYSTCGTCGEPPADGSSCVASNCGRNQECVWNNVTNRLCESFRAEGSSCGANSSPPCGTDLTCANASSVTGALGTCEPALETLGTTCGTKNQDLGCDSLMGLWCIGQEDQPATCASISYVGDGMPCGYVSGGVTECAGGECYSSGGPYFTYTGDTMTGVCKAYASDGAACDTASGPPCLSPARCVTSGGSAGTCVVPVAAVSAMCK